MPGLLHKYHGRVLLTLTGACAINCRYCFRRHFSYNDNKLPRSNWHLLINYINNHPAIHEVILSGGDPLLVTNDYFKDFINELTKIPHLKTLRIHSRVPVVLPERIDDEWLAIMEKIKLNKVLVLHTNHPNEWDNDIHLICAKMHEAKITLLNQSVLLGGVNDNSDILIKLSHTLFASKVLPYYLHVLDPVKGAQHFTVKDAEIKKIYKQIQSSLPGYLVPKLVQEIANKKNKMLYNT
jgi:EF-P beta-lysylation protein EpmB